MGELAFMPKMVSATYYCHTVEPGRAWLQLPVDAHPTEHRQEDVQHRLPPLRSLVHPQSLGAAAEEGGGMRTTPKPAGTCRSAHWAPPDRSLSVSV